MKRSGPVPRWTEQVNVHIGESINSLWVAESKESKLTKSILGRIALVNYFEDPLTIITLLPAQPGEQIHKSSLGVTPEQLALIDERAALLQTSQMHIASMMVASRYVDPSNYHVFNVHKGLPSNQDARLPVF